MPLTRSQLLRIAHAFVAACNTWTVSSIISIRSPTCIYHTLPALDDRPLRNNAEFGALVKPILPVFRGFRLRIVDEMEMVVDVETQKVVMRLRSHVEAEVGLYENEYVFVLRVSEDEGLVDEVVEFLDSEDMAKL